MNEFIPRKTKIEDSKFLESFEITSKRVEISSKYLIAHIRFLSKDFNSALKLYIEVLSSISKEKQSDILKILHDRCFESINIVYQMLLRLAYKEWVKSQDDKELENIKELFREYDSFDLKSDEIERIRAIILVLNDKDFSTARKILQKVKISHRDATWILNSAFLNACKGNLKKAAREYKSAGKQPSKVFESNLIGDVE